MEIKLATRQGVRPLIGFYSESGGGKTYSALLLARGFVGPKGRIVIVDTENKRGALYADVAPFAPYEILDLGEPYTPARYSEAVDLVEASGASIGIIDSGSHEWEGPGGVCDMADDNRTKSGKDGLHNWRKPKLEHAMFVQRIMRSSIPWIVCLRAKFKTRQVKEAGKKAEIVKDDYLTPLQSEEFIFEATVHGEIDLNHNFHPRKTSHPGLAACFPKGAPIELEHGRMLAEWCASDSKPAAEAKKVDPKVALLTELRAVTESIHGWKKGASQADWPVARQKLEGWLIAKGIIGEGAELADLEAGRLTEVLAETKTALANAS